MALKYKRILLKISGEALGGEKGMGFDEPTMDAICGGVKKAHELGVQIGIVVGGGGAQRGILCQYDASVVFCHCTGKAAGSGTAVADR